MLSTRGDVLKLRGGVGSASSGERAAEEEREKARLIAEEKRRYKMPMTSLMVPDECETVPDAVEVKTKVGTHNFCFPFHDD